MKILSYYRTAKAVYCTYACIVHKLSLAQKQRIVRVIFKEQINGFGKSFFHLACRCSRKSYNKQSVNIYGIFSACYHSYNSFDKYGSFARTRSRRYKHTAALSIYRIGLRISKSSHYSSPPVFLFFFKYSAYLVVFK